MSASIMDLIEFFDGEGAFVFVECPVGGPPVFHMQTSADLCAGKPQVAGCLGSGVMLAMEELCKYPSQLRGMVYTIVNDMMVTGAYSDTVEMAEYLAIEARKIPYAPYVSGAGQLLHEIDQHSK
ncbi:hypothetical protein DFJ58DRAFT_734247 [Suillus subalutaceus]|uniref:uncharacterized protein n=1 Tax=Suillus subalutaceus TaxID=48586 RepID=UPI001B887241|nr:uncharacterized protein DFJ58DRAFT_734247 [Suillus subalutaceus]KAG1837643.1 hypothetical protein DFJ58DRAFT_734247 [Suillus subalutaceus]